MMGKDLASPTGRLRSLGYPSFVFLHFSSRRVVFIVKYYEYLHLVWGNVLSVGNAKRGCSGIDVLAKTFEVV